MKNSLNEHSNDYAIGHQHHRYHHHPFVGAHFNKPRQHHCALIVYRTNIRFTGAIFF